MDYVKEVESGINKQNAEVGAEGPGGGGRRRQYRRTLEQQRGSGLRMVEQASGGERTSERRGEEEREREGERGGDEGGGSRRNGRVLLGVERGEREGKS